MPLDTESILAELDVEIERLTKIRAALMGSESTATEVAGTKKRGRPKGSKNAASTTSITAAKGKRQLTPEGRKRIADAMKKRWADRKKAA